MNARKNRSKMRKLIYTLLIAVIATVALQSCEDIITYDEMPQITFSKVYIADTLDELQNDIKLQRIHVEVIDGDGNLGLNRDDNSGYYHPDSIWYNNLFVSIFHKKADGTYEELSDISENMRYRIPYKAPVGQNKYLKAEVIIKVEIPLEFINYDTIRYEFFIYDRDLNKSEVAQSCDIPIRKHGTIWADGHTSLVADKEESSDDKQ